MTETPEQRRERRALIIYAAEWVFDARGKPYKEQLAKAIGAARAIEASDATVQGWQPIESIPDEFKDGRKVLVWHDHDSDPYHEPEPSTRLTTYGAHCEGLPNTELRPGAYIARFGGAYDEDEGYIPAWWFKDDADGWEHPLAPTHFMPLPAPPPAK